MKYNRKMRLVHADGTMNTGGPGYDVDRRGKTVIVNPILYNKNVHRVLKEEYNEYKKMNANYGQIMELLSLT